MKKEHKKMKGVKIYKHVLFNPRVGNITEIIQEAQKNDPQWCLFNVHPITEYEWIVIFEREAQTLVE